MKAYRILPILLCLLFAGCDAAQNSDALDNTAEQIQEKSDKTPVSRETTIGPVHAVVWLSDENPRLGEQIELKLIVDADPGVTVTMPEFGDQLGRFTIANYKASNRLRDDGRYEYTQEYSLDLPMSGRLRTPSFLVEFKESGNDAKIQELLTDEITFEVASVFADGEVPEDLYPIKGELDELVIPENEKGKGWLWGGLALLVAAGVGIGVWSRKRRKEIPALPPEVIALRELTSMQNEKIPSEPADVDAWYVRLSSVIRHYLEGRFDLQAPRLTTEEFFELAKRSDAISEEQKSLLKRLLELSDRVKFSDFLPAESDSKDVLKDAYQFVMDTRIVDESDKK